VTARTRRAGLSPAFSHGRATLHQADCLEWLAAQEEPWIHGVVCDPPYGLVEYTDKEMSKLREGCRRGVWRLPPSFDGATRSPLPRFTTLSEKDLLALDDFFSAWAGALLPVLVPGAHVLVASNPLVAGRVGGAIREAGFEPRGSVIRLLQTMRGGDRPKGAHEEFSDVSVMPRSQHEPWLLFRKPFEGRVQDCLRTWGTGGLRRISDDRPFGDVIHSAPASKRERALAPHPNLKPQAFMRRVVRAILPLGEGMVLDPFAGSGATLAAAEAVGYASVGIERDPEYVAMAREGIPALAAYEAG
jgi:site-specific DNA-methyltransferase (adenine-specific)